MKTEVNKTRLALKAAKQHLGDAPVIGVEVGTSFGENAETILKDFPNITKLYLVDSFPVCPDFMDAEVQKKHKATLIDKFKDDPRVELILKDSVEAAKQIEDKSVDFIYIDANHLYEPVKEDILAWLPKVKEGGIIGGHDYDYFDKHTGWHSVKKAVNEIFSKGDIKIGLTLQAIDLENFWADIAVDWWVRK